MTLFLDRLQSLERRRLPPFHESRIGSSARPGLHVWRCRPATGTARGESNAGESVCSCLPAWAAPSHVSQADSTPSSWRIDRAGRQSSTNTITTNRRGGHRVLLYSQRPTSCELPSMTLQSREKSGPQETSEQGRCGCWCRRQSSDGLGSGAGPHSPVCMGGCTKICQNLWEFDVHERLVSRHPPRPDRAA